MKEGEGHVEGGKLGLRKGEKAKRGESIRGESQEERTSK